MEFDKVSEMIRIKEEIKKEKQKNWKRMYYQRHKDEIKKKVKKYRDDMKILQKDIVKIRRTEEEEEEFELKEEIRKQKRKETNKKYYQKYKQEKIDIEKNRRINSVKELMCCGGSSLYRIDKLLREFNIKPIKPIKPTRYGETRNPRLKYLERIRTKIKIDRVKKKILCRNNSELIDRILTLYRSQRIYEYEEYDIRNRIFR